MNLKTALFSATALGLLMGVGAVRADDNRVYLDQVGSNNSALVTQSSSGNRAGINDGTLIGSPPDNPNPLNTYDGRILQYGSNQTLVINQVGSNNQAGTSTANPWIGINQGESALSTLNKLTIAQESSANIVARVRQVGSDNQGTITQKGGDTNFISHFYQEHDNIANVTQDGEQNWLGAFGNARVNANGGAIYQAVHYNAANQGSNLTFTQEGDFNLTVRMMQRGGFETAVVDINGNNNLLKMIDQSTGLGGDLIGMNELYANVTGNYNGSGAGAMPGTIPGYRNYGSFTVGSSAATALAAAQAYAVSEAAIAGASGFVVAAIPDGTSSFLSSMHQMGRLNDLTFDVVGDSNQFGLLQGGDQNVLDVDVVGGFNQLGVVEYGDFNNVSARQDGDGNDAGVSIKGNTNFIALKQDNGALPGTGNKATISITGNGNNNSLTNPFTGAAQTALSAVHAAPLGDNTLGHGDLYQVGDSNSLTLTVASSNNMFATYQKGNNNTIIGTIGGGTANQAVVSQIGNTNVSNFSQNGASNVLGVTQ